jgi:putative endonuclease
MHYVYLLKSEKDDEYYIGQTGDVVERFRQHNAGQVRSTRARRPLRLLGYRALATSAEARYVEYQLKHHSDKKYAFIREVLGGKEESK